MSGFGQHGAFPASGVNHGVPETSAGHIGTSATAYTSNLEKLDGLSNGPRKSLPLRQQTDKATIRYSGVTPGGSSAMPLMLTGHGRPTAVPLFSHSDIQYLRQQVQQYSTPPGMMNNVLFTSFVKKPVPTTSTSGYTYTITNGPVSNITGNVGVQPATAHAVSQPTVPPQRNPYARPMSAQEIQPPDALGSMGSLVMQSSSHSSLGSSNSPAMSASTNVTTSSGSTTPSPGTQTNVFMKPQATTVTNSSNYKSERRSTHSTINVKKNKLGSVIYRPNIPTSTDTTAPRVITNTSCDIAPVMVDVPMLHPVSSSETMDLYSEFATNNEPLITKANHVLVNAVIKPNSNSGSITVKVPRPPSATKRTVVAPANKAAPIVNTHSHNSASPESYSFVTNIPDHPGPKPQNRVNLHDSKATANSGYHNPTESSPKDANKLITNMIPKSSIPRPGTAARSRPGSASRPGSGTHPGSGTRPLSGIRPEDSPAHIRNLNYTPTKPYHEINNNYTVDQGKSKTNDSDQPIVLPTGSPKSAPGGGDQTTSPLTLKPPVPPANSNNKTMFYHKTSKTEIVLHRVPVTPPTVRPATEGAPAKAACTERMMGVPTASHEQPDTENDEWQDEDEESDDGDTRGERLPGDGEDDSDYDVDNEDDDDDVGFEDDDAIDDIDDDLVDESDAESSAVSRAGSARSRATTLRIRSATKRLLGLSLQDSSRRPVTGRTRPISAVSTLSSNSELQPALTPSLFPNIPPTINFVNVGEKVEQLPWEIRKLFKWRMSPITPNVVKNCINRSGFRPTKKNHDWLGYWGKHMKAQGFKAVREYQKVNHFPGSFQIGRKDRLWRNLSRLQVQYGKKEFGFFPQTYVLPPDVKQLKRAFEDGGNKQKWIIKPPASARGIGIRVIHKWNQIPRKRAVIVQRYLSRPYLINDSKFDLRIYVYVTSYDPLRIYVYEDGLVRFASCKYSQAMKNLSNKYMHLTNYSINKKNNEYQSNSDDSVCQGHKWSLKSLWGYMKKQGVNTNAVWQSMLDLIVKTVISSESAVNSMVKANVRRRYCCNELFGFDIMLDDMLKPWIIEVNISPSLHSNSQLDINVKGGMIKDLMNLAGFTIPAKNDITPAAGSPAEPGTKFMVPAEICTDRRLHPNQMAPDEKAKHAYYCQRANDEVQQTLLDILTPDDLRIITETIDEDSRKGSFVRAFPNFHSRKYLRFFDQPRYYNLLLDAWVHRYHRMESRGILLLERFCSQGLHLQNPTDDPRHQWGPPASLSSRDMRGATSVSGMLKGSADTFRLDCGATCRFVQEPQEKRSCDLAEAVSADPDLRGGTSQY